MEKVSRERKIERRFGKSKTMAAMEKGQCS
jgi:ribosomal protein L32